MPTRVKIFFGGTDLEGIINEWLSQQPSEFSPLKIAMTPAFEVRPGKKTDLAVSLWYTETPPPGPTEAAMPETGGTREPFARPGGTLGE